MALRSCICHDASCPCRMKNIMAIKARCTTCIVRARVSVSPKDSQTDPTYRHISKRIEVAPKYYFLTSTHNYQPSCT